MWGIKKTARKLEPADEALLQRLQTANDALPESHRVTATLRWVKGMLLAEDAETRRRGRGAMSRIVEWLL